MKKFIIVISSLVLTLSLVACNNDNLNKDDTNSETQEINTIDETKNEESKNDAIESKGDDAIVETIGTFKSYISEPKSERALFVDESNQEFEIIISDDTKIDIELEKGSKYKITHRPVATASIPPIYNQIYSVEKVD